MGPLTEPYETEAHSLIHNKFNKTQTYLDNHPKASYNTANAEANKYLVKHSIVKRARTLAQAHNKLNLENTLNEVALHYDATKAIPINGRLQYVPDHAIQLAAKKFMINDVYGLRSTHIGNVNIDNRSVSMQVNKETTVNLATTLDNITKLTTKMTHLGHKSGKVIVEDAEVVDAEGVSNE